MKRGLLIGLLLLGGCKRERIDVAPLSAESEVLSKNQSELLDRRGALQRERKKIADARADLVDRRSKLLADSAGRAALDVEERKLNDDESALVAQEAQLNSKLDELLKMRAELVQKATTTVAGAPINSDPTERAARREQGVATREKDLARREADLADRERQLADREAKEARREKETCGPQLVMPVLPKVEKGLKYSAHDVEPVYRRALKLMQERGLLSSDLPPGANHLVDETRDLMKSADYVRAKYEADQLLATVEQIKIDRNFIAAKMARLSSAMKGHRLDGSERKSLESLFQDATANYGDGKFGDANGKINKLFALLR
jgi:cell division protein FtsI/penicillin-binding protein 2